MYSLAPLASVENSHTGFYFATFLMVLFFYVWFDDDGYQEREFVVPVIFLLVYGFLGFISFNYDSSITRKNEEVIADFVEFRPEQESYRCGKNSTCYSSKMYGVFDVPEGLVILNINPSYPMPKRVILYKN